MHNPPTEPLIQDLDLVASVEVKHHKEKLMEDGKEVEKECYHFLYASTLYGTLFGVFGKFSITADDGESCEVTSVKLRILNYKGVLNIGFGRDSIEDDYKDAYQTFYLKGGSGKDELTIPFTPHLKVPASKHFRLTFVRELEPLQPLPPGGDHTTRRDTPNQKDTLFDTEYHYRDGAFHRHQVVFDKMPLNKSNALVSIRCIQGVVNLVYTP